MARAATSRRLRSTALALILGLVASAFTIGGPVREAKADDHLPWNQPGSAWQGTINTTIHVAAHNESGGYTREVSSANYTNLLTLSSTAQGDYAAAISTSGTDTYTGTCGDGSPMNDVLSWTASVPQNENVVLRLHTDEAGSTSFTPVNTQGFDGTYKSTCTEEDSETPWAVGGNTINFNLQFFQEDSTSPLTDTDPDPLHLVGQRTWTVGDWPIAPDEPPPNEYSFTATYDLQLVTDECVDSNVTHDVVTAEPGNGVDQLEFELRTTWCKTEAGTIRIIDTSGQGSTLISPFEAAVEEGIRELFTIHNEWAPTRIDVVNEGAVATVTGTGKWKDCWGLPLPVRPKRLRSLASILEKVAARSDKRLVKWAADKAARMLNRTANKIDEWGDRAIHEALVLFADFVDALPRAVQERITILMVAVVGHHHTYEPWAERYVQGMPQKRFGKLLGDDLFCVTRWKPRIIQTLNVDNTSSYEYVDLDDDWGDWNVRRTGGSS